MRILVMGTGPFAVPTFFWLIESPHEVIGLITRPTRPAKGRHQPPPNPMRSFAEEHGVVVHDPESINEPESLEMLKEFGADLFMVCDYGQILSREALSLAKLGGINLHGSLLPKYRGAAPINWAILNGDRELGITVIHMTAKLDGGPSLAKRSIMLDDDDTAVEAEAKLSEIGVEAVAESIDLLANWDGNEPIGELQDAAQATRAPRLSKRDGLIDWSHSAVNIRNRLRALQPWPGVYTNWQGKKQPLRLILTWLSVPAESTSAEPGTIIRSEKDRLWVATGEGVISIDRIQPAGKKPMEIEEFLRGHPIPVGDRLE